MSENAERAVDLAFGVSDKRDIAEVYRNLVDGGVAGAICLRTVNPDHLGTEQLG
jgi:hypothetical protein